ncbi:uncharacterized protein LOC126825253 [Patella vulgata]|uniref:uncharacterized protein LOC126825253 n=1 Tax=Patella vulgata TaxID=6465 RepID=UPI00217FE2BF|nr:uncharacterized protein LOC126825253 [Patella vulgata]XP_050410789.1 uncharacterized protein LOC126825253 [Patella vulgata]
MKKGKVKPVSGLIKIQKVSKSTGNGCMFPWYSSYLIFLVTIVIRVCYVSQPSNWWILHPDEIYQSLEVAHSEVYGYGFRPYEYLTGEAQPNNTRIRERELQLGMAAMRSFLFPGFFVFISYCLEVLNVDVQPFLSWKISHACITSTLPLAVFIFTKRLFGSHDAGVMAAVLASSSIHLNVFGTHTLINSFLAPFVFLSLSYILPVAHNTCKGVQKEQHGQSDAQDVCTDGTRRCGHSTVYNSVTESKNSSQPTTHTNVAHKRHKTDQQEKYSQLKDINSNIQQPNTTANNSTSKDVGRVSAPFVNSVLQLYDMVPNGLHGLKKIHGWCNMEGNMSQMEPRKRYTTLPLLSAWTSTHPQNLIILCSSFVLTLSCYIRPDLTIFCLIVYIPHCHINRLMTFRHVYCGVGATLALSICLRDDFSSYGYGVISPFNWFNFNVLQHFSGALFGTMEFTFYLKVLFIESSINLLLLAFSVTVVCGMVIFGHRESIVIPCKSMASFVFLFVFYSLQGHKEPRHIHHLFCLYYVIIAGIICSYLKSNFNPISSRKCVIFLSCILIVNGYKNFPSPTDKSNRAWVYAGIYHSNDVNTCLNYVAHTEDVTGVFLDTSIHMAGGYSVLHRDVPVLTLLIHEFYEFDFNSRLNLTSKYNMGSKKAHVSTFSRVSNFISVRNTPYLLKFLINNPKYNYLIIGINRSFINFGYKEVFRSGNMSVLRRTFNRYDEAKLSATAKSIPTGRNATVLNYEGNWLFNLGAFEQAVRRLEASLSIDQSIINNYQLLSNIYYYHGDRRQASTIMEKCYKLYNKNTCSEATPPRTLHSNYYISL